MRFLIKQGASLDVVDNNGDNIIHAFLKSPLHINEKPTHYFFPLFAGEKFDLPNKDNKTPYDVASDPEYINNPRSEVFLAPCDVCYEKILKFIADIKSSNLGEIQEYLKNVKHVLVSVFNDRSATPLNIRDRFGHTPVHIACQYSSHEVILYLIAEGANLTKQDDLGIIDIIQEYITTTRGRVVNQYGDDRDSDLIFVRGS